MIKFNTSMKYGYDIYDYDKLPSAVFSRFKGVTFDAPKKPRMDFIAAKGGACFCEWSGGKKINAKINLGSSGGCRVPRTIAHEVCVL